MYTSMESGSIVICKYYTHVEQIFVMKKGKIFINKWKKVELNYQLNVNKSKMD